MAVTKLSNSGIKTGVLKYDSMLAGNPAFDPAATWLIERVTSTGSSATITFSNIPSTYQHLQIRGIYNGSGGFLMRLNGSSTAVYTLHYLSGDGSSASASGSGYGPGYFNWTMTPTGSTDTKHAMIMDILDYGSTTKNKTVRIFDGYDENGDGDVTLFSGLWGNTNAITSITLDSNGTWGNKTTFALYGIKGV